MKLNKGPYEGPKGPRLGPQENGVVFDKSSTDKNRLRPIQALSKGGMKEGSKTQAKQSGVTGVISKGNFSSKDLISGTIWPGNNEAQSSQLKLPKAESI